MDSIVDTDQGIYVLLIAAVKLAFSHCGRFNKKMTFQYSRILADCDQTVSFCTCPLEENM